jgi:hypothetical protein
VAGDEQGVRAPMIVGVDLSTHRIDLAWMAGGKPQRWHQKLEGKTSIDRIRQIHVRWPTSIVEGDTTEVVLEWPFGRSSNYLMAVVGILTHQAPSWARVSWLKCDALRTAIGARNNKRDAHYRLDQIFTTVNVERFRGRMPDIDMPLLGWDEHELDALVTCLGGTHILEHPMNNPKEPHA